MARTKSLGAAYWREIINEFERSGESQAKFVRRKKLNPSTFYKWRRRLDEQPKQPAFVEINPPSADVVVVCGEATVRFEPGVAATRIAEIVLALSQC